MERHGTSAQAVTARSLGLLACTHCGRVQSLGAARCDRCGATIVSRDRYGLQRVWAWWLVGLICYVPANLYPMLRTRTLLSQQEDTIIGGAVELAHHGAYGIAAIILIASVVIPLAKFAAIAVLALSVTHNWRIPKDQLGLTHEIVEYIGRWSMIDIFVVAILSAVVQLNALAGITPGPASLFFALSVIFTMLSAKSFDPRMIWDVRAQREEQNV